MTTFVLVPGAWMGAWAWDAVTPALEAQGHTVHALTLPGLAERAGDPVGTLDLARHVDDVVGRLEALDLRDVTLVGHSYSGMVVTGVAGRVPGRIGRLVYIASAPPPAGVSMFDLLGPEGAAGMEAMAAAAGDPAWLPFPAPDVRDRYYPLHGLEGALGAAVAARVTPHPLATFRGSNVAGDPAADSVPKAYLHMAGDGEPLIADGTPDWRTATLPTGHWPMFTMPDRLAALLDEMAS